MQNQKAAAKRFSPHSIFRQTASRPEEIAIAVMLVLAVFMLLYLIETT